MFSLRVEKSKKKKSQQTTILCQNVCVNLKIIVHNNVNRIILEPGFPCKVHLVLPGYSIGQWKFQVHNSIYINRHFRSEITFYFYF